MLDNQSMDAVYDLIILGAGCAGLSLAKAMNKSSPNQLRTLLIEQRKEYANDRTWCFWRSADAAVVDVDFQWQNMSVRLNDAHLTQRMTIDCGEMPYQMVSGSHFYSDAFQVIDADEKLTLLTGTVVLQTPHKQNSVWQITTNQGVFFAQNIVDTRPPVSITLVPARMWQSFYGHEVVCDSSIFDATCVDLMDFLPKSDKHASDIAFVYVLPFSSNRALIELTVFSAAAYTPKDLKQRLDDAIQKRLNGAGFSISRSEQGILPMGLARQTTNPDSSYVNVGLMSGGARASTGYAFLRIQRWSNECAFKLHHGKPPSMHTSDSTIVSAMDRLFISVLLQHPEQAAGLFFNLFKSCSPLRLIRFLNGAANVFDYVAVVLAMPKWLFIKTLMGFQAKANDRDH